ncbi:hypothetical protein KBX08_04365 [Micromonospora sp. H61]|nr:hypothetical protein [Micromonospora sp. H61]MBQ0989324.1 hypothetical protein [Micromonospora sp. H61]
MNQPAIPIQMGLQHPEFSIDEATVSEIEERSASPNAWPVSDSDTT